MCGLAGIFHSDRNAPGDVDAALLRRMTTALAHRGPDGDGFHLEPGLGLGHRRLSLNDPEGGHQPMYNEDQSVVIVFNGMIYNFNELRPKLQALGHVFRNRCDTEAIIHAWESWGTDCLDQLSGMFAFALWDRNRRQLFLARDRLGKKPLHYATTTDGRFVFASELAGLAQIPALPRRIDPEAVDDFFAFGYVPDPRTIYRDIHKLQAGHYLLLEPGAAPVQRRYWSVPTASHRTDATEGAAALIDRLRAATGKRLVADVPLGAFLSGGVDSSAVVAMAAGLRDRPLDTFTIGFPGAEDETRFAEQVAARYATTQHDQAAARVDYIDAARTQAAIFGEPFGDSSSVPTHAVCALARRHATVAISGDGGDEVFAGYRRHRWHRLTEAVRAHIPAGVRRRVIGELARAYPKLDRAPRWLRAKHTLTELSLDSALGYVRTLTKVHHDRRRALFSTATERGLDGYDPTARVAALMRDCDSDDALAQAQYVDINTYLVGDILTKVDRASMACSLEVRAPFLDHDVVAFGLGLPASLKLHGRDGKWLLKRALEPYLPREILYRRKQGFATSLAAPLRARADDLRARLLGPAMGDCGLFDLAAIGQLINEHQDGRFDHAGALWLLLAFEGFLFAAAGPGPAIPVGAQPAEVGAHA